MIFQLSPSYDFTNFCVLLPLSFKSEITARLTLSFGVTNALSLALSLAQATLHFLLPLALKDLTGQGTASYGAIKGDDVVSSSSLPSIQVLC